MATKENRIHTIDGALIDAENAIEKVRNLFMEDSDAAITQLAYARDCLRVAFEALKAE